MDCVVIDYGVADNVLTIECIEVDRLIARVEAAEASVKHLRAQTDRLVAAEEAVGIIAAAVPGMEMIPDKPQEMALQVVAECDRLRSELEVTRNLLNGVPEHSEGWYAGICDYLEMLDPVDRIL